MKNISNDEMKSISSTILETVKLNLDKWVEALATERKFSQKQVKKLKIAYVALQRYAHNGEDSDRAIKALEEMKALD